MAKRRMFARSITGSARFLRMPPASRLLYYDLGMAADDDGCVEAFAVMRMTGATEDDLNVLVTKGFVRILNEDLVAYITDWQTNNQIRKDRYREGRYKGLIDCGCDGKPLPDKQVTTGWQPDGNQMGDGLATEVRLGKGMEADKPPARPQFSPPSVQDVADYCREKDCAVDAQRFVDYYSSVGWKRGKTPIKNWQAAVRTWARKDTPAPAAPKDDHCGYVLAPLEDPFEVAVRNRQEASRV